MFGGKFGGGGPPHSRTAIQAQLHKRLSLNLLIQGAAAHTYVSAHHLVRDELEQLQPGLVRQYDRLAANLHLTQWLGDLFLFLGRPKRFWKRIGRPDHPFHGHAFLTRHGSALARASFRDIRRRARKLNSSGVPGVHSAELLWMLGRMLTRERRHTAELEALCVKATAQIWGIDPARLSGSLTQDVEFGNLHEPKTRSGRMLRSAAAGYGGVVRTAKGFQVVAKAWTWPLLAHELTKGTAELVCLHGLNRLDDLTYDLVTAEADRIEHEIWMIQAGGELWRKFLAAVPKIPGRAQALAEALMHVARMEPDQLEQFLFDLMEHPLTARATLCDAFDAMGDSTE